MAVTEKSTLQKNIAVASFEKNIAREVFLPHIKDIALNLEKDVTKAFCLLHFTDIALNLGTWR